MDNLYDYRLIKIFIKKKYRKKKNSYKSNLIQQELYFLEI